MPIPTSNMQENVQTPKAAQGKALDLSREAEQSVKLAASMAAPIAAGVPNALSIATTINNAKELKTANDAYTLYSPRMVDLNAQLATKSEDEAVAFQDEYNKTALKYHNEFLGAINDVSNRQIQEEARSRVNKFNLQNREQTAIKFDKENRMAQVRSERTAQDMLVSNTLASFNPSADRNDNKLTFEDLSVQLEGHVRAQLAAQGILNENVIQQATQEAREKALTTVRQYLDENNTNTGAWKSNATAIQAIRDAKEAGLISDQYAQKALKEEESQQLSIEVMRRPEQFLTKNYKFNPNGRPKFAPELSQYEYERIARHAEQAAANYRAAIEAPVKQELQDKLRSEELDFRLNTGLVTKDDLKLVARMLGKNPESEKTMEKLSKFFAERLENTSRAKLRKHLVALEQTRDRAVIIDTTGKLINEAPSAADIQNAMRNGAMRVIYPWQDDKEVNDAIKTYGDMVQIGGLESVYNDKDLKPSFLEGKNVTVERKIDDMGHRIFAQNAKYGNHETSYAMEDEVITTALELAQTGFQVPEGKGADGKIKYRTLQLDVSKISDDKSPEEAYIIGAALKEAMRRTMPYNVVQEMAQRMKDYQDARHTPWTPVGDMSGDRPGGFFTTTVDLGNGMAIRVPRLLIPVTMNTGKEYKASWDKMLGKLSPQKEGLTHNDEDVYAKCAVDNMQELTRLLQED